MSHAGLSSTVGFCILQQDELTNQMTDIMMQITQACKDESSLATKTSDAKTNLKAEYADYLSETDSPQYKEYKDEKDDLQEEYELQLQKITAWESELETQKDSLETEIQATSAYKESFTSLLKTNVQSDFKYGGSSS